MKDNLQIKGIYEFEIRDTEGKVRDSWSVENTVVSAGLAELANLCGDVSTPTAFTYLAVGTSNTAVAAGQTALQAEISDSGLERAAGSVSRQTTTVSNDTFQITYTWTASGSKTVEEVGVFNDASAGTMLSRALTTSKAVTSGETLTGTYKLVFANA